MAMSILGNAHVDISFGWLLPILYKYCGSTVYSCRIIIIEPGVSLRLSNHAPENPETLSAYIMHPYSLIFELSRPGIYGI